MFLYQKQTRLIALTAVSFDFFMHYDLKLTKLISLILQTSDIFFCIKYMKFPFKEHCIFILLGGSF